MYHKKMSVGGSYEVESSKEKKQKCPLLYCRYSWFVARYVFFLSKNEYAGKKFEECCLSRTMTNVISLIATFSDLA